MKHFRYLFSCLLVAAIVLTLSGCGQTETEQVTENWGYSATVVETPIELGIPVNFTAYSNTLIVAGINNGTQTLARYDADSGKWGMKALNIQSETAECCYGLATSTDGTVWYLSGQDIQKDEPFTGQYTVVQYEQLTETVPSKEFTLQLPDITVLYGLSAAANGSLFVWDYSNLYGLDTDGKLLCTLEFESISGVFPLGEELLVACSRGNKNGLCIVDPAKNTIGTFQESEVSVLPTLCVSQKSQILLNSIGVLWSYDRETEQSAKLFSWSSVDVLFGNYVVSTALMKNSDIFCLDLYTGQLLRISYGPLPERTVLTLAVSGEYLPINQAVSQFNKNQTEYRIEVKNYNEPFNPNKLVELTADLLSENCPDIVIPASFGVDVDSGNFVDLFEYLDQDAELSREDFLPNVLNGMLEHGCLYELYVSFCLDTMIASDKLALGPDWTIQDLGESGNALFSTMTSESLLDNICYFASAEFVDWESGVCDFANERFIHWLELCGSLMNTGTAEDTELHIQTALIRNCQSALSSEGRWAESDYVGYPESKGNGSYLFYSMPRFSLAIPNNSAHKDAAWQFIRTFLTPSTQASMSYLGFPIREDVLKYMIDGAVSAQDSTFTREDGARLMELIQSTELVSERNDALYDIIQEEAEPFLAGERTAAQAAEIIQDRVNILVSEKH